jgi:hypothetical protein
MKYTSKYHTHEPIKKKPEYVSFTNMLSRCYNPNTTNYGRWGGRGIKVCDRWLEHRKGFDNFLVDMGYKPTVKHQLDRIDNNKDYSPKNCRWATQKEQMNNTSKSLKIEYGGNIWDIPSLALAFGIKEATLRNRIKTVPKKFWATHGRVPVKRPGRILKSERVFDLNGNSHSIAQWETITGIPRYTILKRISDYGWSVEKSLTVKPKHGGNTDSNDFSTGLMAKLLDM